MLRLTLRTAWRKLNEAVLTEDDEDSLKYSVMRVKGQQVVVLVVGQHGTIGDVVQHLNNVVTLEHSVVAIEWVVHDVNEVCQSYADSTDHREVGQVERTSKTTDRRKDTNGDRQQDTHTVLTHS